MHVLRTPDARFAGLADYPFAPNYLEIADADGTRLRSHFVDEGPRDGRPVLLLHGEPSWSYLYRKMIPALAAQGFRVVAPDLIGFGKSDKPAARTDYTYARHLAWLTAWFDAMKLSGVTLFCQDWGGLLGLRLVAAQPEKFAAVIAGNTFLPIGQGKSAGFESWLNFSQSVPQMPIGGILTGGCARDLSEAERAAYDAPFPDESCKEGARQFPVLVPVTPEHDQVAENIAAWAALERFEKPFVTAFSDGDAVTAGMDKAFQERVPGAKGQRHVTVRGGHFLQEDSPDELVAVIADVAKRAG